MINVVVQVQWVIPEKIHTSPMDGKLEIQVGGGIERVWKSRWDVGSRGFGNAGGRGNVS